jgi:hypothetical protein
VAIDRGVIVVGADGTDFGDDYDYGAGLVTVFTNQLASTKGK